MPGKKLLNMAVSDQEYVHYLILLLWYITIALAELVTGSANVTICWVMFITS